MCDIDADIHDDVDDAIVEETVHCTLCGFPWQVGGNEPGIICTLPDKKDRSPGFSLCQIKLCEDCALFVSRTFDQHLHELDKCEHGVICGDWCEPCNRAYKDALYENSIEDVRRENAQLRNECADKAIAKLMANMIDYLRKDEGDSVEIYSADPADEGPGQAINVCGGWNDYHLQMIEGKTLLDCLQKAADLRRKKETCK